MDLGIIKSDVINELRTERYYNEQEITRLVQPNSDINHKMRVISIAKLTKANVTIMEAIKLVDIYFPAAAPKSSTIPSDSVTDQGS